MSRGWHTMMAPPLLGSLQPALEMTRRRMLAAWHGALTLMILTKELYRRAIVVIKSKSANDDNKWILALLRFSMANRARNLVVGLQIALVVGPGHSLATTNTCAHTLELRNILPTPLLTWCSSL
jgi:hypothetical protein